VTAISRRYIRRLIGLAFLSPEPRTPARRLGALIEEVRFARDSPLEEGRFIRRGIARRRCWLGGGTESSNLPPSSSESTANPTFGGASERDRAKRKPAPTGQMSTQTGSEIIGNRRVLLPGAAAVRCPGGVGGGGVPLAWVWNLALMAGLISLPLGWNHGLKAGELPLFAEIPLFLVTATATAQFIVTISHRLERAPRSRL